MSGQRAPAGGRPVGDWAAKRTELLKVALTLIAEKGYAGTSLRDVARQAGCSTGTVTYYFPSKDAMMAAAVDSLFDVFDAMVGDRMDVGAGLRLWLAWMVGEDPGAWSAGVQLLAHARRESALADALQRRYAQYRDRLTAILVKRQRQGAIRDDIPAHVLADLLCAMGDGWMIRLPVEPERFQPARVQALLDAAMALVAPPQS